MKFTKKEVFSIPNILSFVRILLIPVFIAFYLTAKIPLDYYIAAAVILISGPVSYTHLDVYKRQCPKRTAFRWYSVTI